VLDGQQSSICKNSSKTHSKTFGRNISAAEKIKFLIKALQNSTSEKNSWLLGSVERSL